MMSLLFLIFVKQRQEQSLLFIFIEVNKLISYSALNLELQSTVAFSTTFFLRLFNIQSYYKASKWAFQTQLWKESSSICMKSTIKIIQEYDDKQVAKEGNVNKAHLHRNMG